MAVLIIAAAGAAAGVGIGVAAGLTGAALLTAGQIGWAIGSALTPRPNQTVVNPALSDLRVTGTEYGQTIPYVQGHPRVAGQTWWASDRRAIPHFTVTGGKGPGGETLTIHYTYEVDLLIGLTDNEIVGVSRIWSNGKLIYTALASATASSILASINTDAWTRMTVYTGAADQLPDPTYEAAVGADIAPAYRHRGYVFIEGLQLGTSGIIPNLTFEVATKATIGELVTSTRLYHLNNALTDAIGGALAFSVHDSAAFTTSPAKFGSHVIGESVSQASWYMDTADAGTTHFNFGTGEFTVDLWVYFNTFPDGAANRQYACIFQTGALGGGAGGIALQANGNYTLLLSSTGSLIWQHRDSTGITRSMDTDGDNPFDVAEWHHVAVIRIANTLYVTVGGVSVMSMALTATDVLSGATQFAVGGTPDGGRTYPLSGYVDELRMVKGVPGWPGVPFTPPTAEYTGSDSSGDVITLLDEELPDVVSRLCVRAGLEADQFDVTALTSITRDVRAMAISQVTPTRQVLEMLAGMFFFEVTLWDKLYFIPRGSASVVTIPYADLGAVDDGDDPAEPLALREANELEIPAQIALTYQNVNADYQTDTQFSDRLGSSLDEAPQEIRVPMGFTQSEAKAIADVILYDRAASRYSTLVSLLGEYARLVPTDPVVATDKDGNTFRIRLVKRTDAYPRLEYEAVLDDVSVLSSQGITSADYTPQTVVDPAVDTLMELMDIPILRNADDDPGFYVAAKGQDTPWPGAAIVKSIDDTDFEEVEAVLESAVFGTCTTTLGDWNGPRVFDEMNSVTVNVGNGTLSSSNRNAMLNSLAVNAMLVGSEVIQFRTATLVETGVYTLTGLLRGGRGTEWAMTGHASMERCVLLRLAGLRRIEGEVSELGHERFYRAVTLGRRLSSAESEAFTNNGIGLKPFSLFDLRASRDGSNNITFTWERRSRRTVRAIGPLGISVPLGEASQAYELDIMGDDSPGEAVLRTLEASTTTKEYTAAQQTADGLTPGDPVTVWAYQISETVGRGYVYERTV